MRFTRMLLLVCLLLTAACSQTPSGSEIAKEEIRLSSLDVNQYPITKTVCDPWGGDPDPRSNQGLIADLWWLESGKPKPNSAAGMIANGKKSDRTLFFSMLDVPTRLFNLGFANATGETIKDDAGGTLIEYFGLKFKSILRLAPGQRAAKYEFAILSDDGAVLNFRDPDGVYRPNVANDGDHPTRLGCASAPVDMDEETEIPMTLEYYQGPRYHISLIVLMREWKGAKDQACGVTGNSTWFDYGNGSKPQKAYTDLLARGWKPLAKDNFGLPNTAMFNPCKEGEAPKISDLAVLERFNDGFIATWKTDILATSQLVATDSSGKQTLTAADNVLRTEHEVRITGLAANTVYQVQAVSISETYGRTVSSAITERTDY